MTIESEQPSTETSATLAALKRAVANALDRKKRLGQYAVVWRDERPALLDEEVEDSEAFYEALKKEPGDKSAAASSPQSGVADEKGEYRSLRGRTSATANAP